MKKNYLLLIMALIIISCNDNDSEQDENNYTFTENSDLKIFSYQADSYMKYGVIESGENLVFEYRFDAYDEELIADDEYSEFIRFEIDSELESFSYSNEELINIDLVFTKACFCYFPMEESKDVSPKGMISGEKISNEKWKIKIDLFFYGDDNRTIEGNFELK